MDPKNEWKQGVHDPWCTQIGPFTVHETCFSKMIPLFLTSLMQHFPFPASWEKGTLHSESQKLSTPRGFWPSIISLFLHAEKGVGGHPSVDPKRGAVSCMTLEYPCLTIWSPQSLFLESIPLFLYADCREHQGVLDYFWLCHCGHKRFISTAKGKSGHVCCVYFLPHLHVQYSQKSIFVHNFFISDLAWK